MSTYFVLTGYGMEHQATPGRPTWCRICSRPPVTPLAARTPRFGETIDAMVLAGGLGTRLRGVIEDLPKAIAPIKGRPFLDIILDRLAHYVSSGRVVIAAGYMAAKASEHMRAVIHIRLKSLCGRKGASWDRRSFEKGAQVHEDGDVLALNGDSYVDADLQICRIATRQGCGHDRGPQQVEDTRRFGTVTT